MPPSRPKPSEVAAETKKNEIPTIKSEYSHCWPTHSYLWQSPVAQISLPRQVDLTSAPDFCYEERLCRRSNLSATLGTPGPGSAVASNYPIPSEGGIYSEFVVVFRGPHDAYEKLPQWNALPVISIPAARWPKLSHGGTKYAFPLEREMVMNKIRAGLLMCAEHKYIDVVIMDFGLGNGNRNPPQEIAEMWRDVFLWDPVLRGRFANVAFVFEDPYQSTTKLIMDDIAKKSKGGSSSKKSKSSSVSSSSSGHSSPSDYDIFRSVFSPQAVQHELTRTDPRCSLSTLTS
ncbi:hypothetical protein LQW54_001993 [Pestalotiopsis sp. IQ-011]